MSINCEEFIPGRGGGRTCMSLLEVLTSIIVLFNYSLIYGRPTCMQDTVFPGSWQCFFISLSWLLCFTLDLTVRILQWFSPLSDVRECNALSLTSSTSIFSGKKAGETKQNDSGEVIFMRKYICLSLFLLWCYDISVNLYTSPTQCQNISKVL